MAVLILSVLTVGASNPLSDTTEEEKIEDDILLVRIRKTEDELRLHGTEVIHRYDDFALIRGGERTAEALEDEGVEVNRLPSRTVIHTGGHEFDFTEGEPEISNELRIENYEPGEKGIYLIHMLGPIASEWVEQIDKMGVDVMNYVHNYAYRVRMTPEQAEDVYDLEFVDWVGVYQPEYKIRPDIELGELEIGLAPGAEFETIERIAEIADVEILDQNIERMLRAASEEEELTFSTNRGKRIREERRTTEGQETLSYIELPDGEFRVIVEIGSEEDLNKIARLNDVYYITEQAEVELHDEMATQTIGGGLWFFDDGPEFPGEHWEGDPYYPYREHGEYGSYMNQIGYKGEGVTIAVADTGLGDGTVGDAGHPDFTGRVVDGYTFGTDGWADLHGHGTHCTGSAAGDTYHGTGAVLYQDPDWPGFLEYYLGQGSAPESGIYPIQIFDPAWVGPEDYFEIFEVAAQYSDSYVHSNSWGSTAFHGEYGVSSPDFDAAVRDSNRATEEHEPMIVTSSAGNDAEMGTPPPATAKNVITVGGTQPFNPLDGFENPEIMYPASSRGFTDDNRVKPDVVAPAQNIISTMPDGTYGAMSGTSMSNPAVAGAAAVTVEWYEDTYGYTPSPAMVRSLLINTANQMGGDTRGPIPNEDEGWGMVDISRLQRPDPTSIYTVDQEDLFTTSGMVYEYDIEHENPEEPLKITLSWTDKEAPRDTGSGPALLNDLDLELESPGGHVYRGNAFEDGWSQPNEDTMEVFDRKGDGWDDTNNVENIYIPADEVEDGVYTVSVIASNIVADSLGIGGPSQDFALAAYNAQYGEMVDEPPSIELERPVGGEEWTAREEEDIEWSVEAGDHDLDRVNLFYSDDGWKTQQVIEVDLDPEVGSLTVEIPNYNTEEAQVRAVVVDVEGNSARDTSGKFTIEGIPPEPPENLLVEHDYTLEEQIFYDDVSEDKGYTTMSTQGVNEWDIRDHDAVVGEQSWDWGDGFYEKVGEASVLESPDIEIPEADTVELTFQHWREIEPSWDGVNLKVYDGEEVTFPDTDPGYDGEIEAGYDNPLEGQPAWWGIEDWEEVTVDLSDYAGETINLRWEAGVEDWDAPGFGGWRIDDIEITMETEMEEPVSNRLRWYASPDEDIGEVSHYNVYRSEEQGGPWDQIDSVAADGSEIYHYLDYDMADEPYHWYVVRAVGTNELEEENEYAKQQPGDDVDLPEITIDQPYDETVWNAYDEEYIQWTTDPGEGDIDYIDYLEYSPDGGTTWYDIDQILDDEDYLWTVPNWNTDEAIIRARVVDEYGRYTENESAEFEIVGEEPDPVENIDVEHMTFEEEWYWEHPGEHQAEPDAAIGLTGEGTWYAAIRAHLPDGEITDISYYDNEIAHHVRGTIHMDTPEGDEPGEMIGATDYFTDTGNFMWQEIPLMEPVRVEEGRYWVVLEIFDVGISADDNFRPAGVIDPYVENAGFISLDGQMWDTLPDVGLPFSWAMEAHVEVFNAEGNEDNMITWDASPHDPYEDPTQVTHYDIYRAAEDWEDPEYVDTVEADGSEDYFYIDSGAGMLDETFWYYNITAVAMNELEAEGEEAVREPIPPEITITSPAEGDELEYGDTWNITWDFTEHQYDIDVVDLYYSLDDGETIYGNVAEGVNATDEEYEWEIPDVYSEEARIIAHVYDVEGNWRANESEAFTIIGEPPAPPEGLLVEYDYYGEEIAFYDDVSEDKGYETGSSEGANEWDIRDHGAYVGDQSWDWGDTDYEKDGEVSWLISPEIEIPEDAESVELTFQHWRDIADTFDGVNLKVSVDGETWELIENPEPSYDYIIETGWGNPIEGEPAWGGSEEWEKVTVDLNDYAGESIWLNWSAGVEDYVNGAEGWRIDDIEISYETELENPVSNQLRWFASPDDPDSVAQYNIYRSEDEEGPWEQIGSVPADGSEEYYYLDEDMAGEPYNWYVVRAVDTYGQEEMNEIARPEPGAPEFVEPEITVDSPVEGYEWHAYDQELIEWSTVEEEYPIEYIELCYSTDGGDTWTAIGMFDDDGEYNWTVPNWPSDEAMIRARVVDEGGRHFTNYSGEFEIFGQAPAPPENLTVEHSIPADWHWMYPDEHRAEPYNALGLGPDETTWHTAIRIELPQGEATEIAFHDEGTAISFKGTIHEDGINEPGEQIGETETVPGTAEPQWREIPLVEPVALEGGYYWIVVEIEDPGEGYFPASMIQGYTDGSGWLTYEGIPWVTLPDVGFLDSWTIEVYVEEEDQDDNLLTWDASPDDPADGRPEEVTHYEIYRNETADMSEAEHIATVEADGSEYYQYIDEGKGLHDDIFWWYEVTAVAINEMESEPTDAVKEPEPPEINITSPVEGDVLEHGEYWNITWEYTEHDHELDTIDLWYSLDGGTTIYDEIVLDYDAAEGVYEWEIPDVYSEEACIIAHAYDVEGNWRQNVSELFTIDTRDPEAPLRVMIEQEEDNNIVHWYASPDDPDRVSHYNIYRAVDDDGEPGEWSPLDSVYADGSDYYEYIDEGAAGDPYYWYLVRAVDVFGQEEMNENAKHEPNNPNFENPDIIIETPEGGDVWYEATTQEIKFWLWGGETLDFDRVELYARLHPDWDWGMIGEVIEPDIYEQPHTFELVVPEEVNSDEVQIRAIVIDTIGYEGEYITEEFSIYEDNEVEHLEITAPYDGALLTDGTVTVEWDSYDHRSGIDYFEVRHIDDEEWTELDDETFDYDFELDDGEHTVEVRAWDIAGNYATESVTFTVDTTDPELIITAPKHGEILSEDSVTVLWDGYDETSDIVEYEVQINGEGWHSVNLRTWHEFHGLAEGSHTVDVRATDEAGHQYTESVDFHIATDQYLEITSPVGGVESLTFEEDFVIIGETSWSTIHIDGEPVDVEDGVFEYNTVLTEGQNVFLVEAVHNGDTVDQTEVYALYLPDIPELWDEIESVEADLQGQIDDLQTQIDDIETDMANLETDLRGQIDDLQSQIDNLETNLQNQIDDLQTQIDELETDMEDLETDLQDHIDDLQSQIDNLETNLQNQIDDLQNELDEFKEEQEEIDEDQDDDISMARNLGIVGLILAILALIIGIVAMTKKGSEPSEEEPMFEEEEFEEESFDEEPFDEEEAEEELFEEESFDEEFEEDF